MSIHPPPDAGRRRFVQGLGLGATAVALGLRPAIGASRVAAGASRNSVRAPATLSGTEFDLRIGRQAVNFTGRRRQAIVVNDSLPAPVLRWREGDTITLRVTNTLDEPTSIHWHGILVPAAMDGVPGLSFPGIAPGETFVYRFPVRQSGTYWYHSHSGMQEQLGLYGALVIDPRDAPPTTIPEHVIVLSDWTDEEPHRVLANLKKQPDYYNLRQRTVADFFRDASRHGFRATMADRAQWGSMLMNPTDLADVSAQTYTYLMNGQAPAANWTALFRPGEPVRLRFINAAAMTLFDVRVPGLKLTVVATDGQPVRPVTVDEFRIGNAEAYDVLVTPEEDRAYTIFAQSMDRTGFARGTLAPRAGMEADVPAPDARVLLTMADMGHGDGASMAGHDMTGHEGHDMSADAAQGTAIHHAPAEDSPWVDMRATNPSPRLDDPGVGLRDNGRRVLTYADLDSVQADPDGREPVRTIELHLTGNMERYTWSFNGQRMSEAGPIRLALGERVRFLLVNDTMMDHPVHLHGMWSDLEDEAGRFKLRKHTLVVKAGHRLSYRVTADAPGAWAYHCHLALHMDTGMFRTVLVAGGEPPPATGEHNHG